MASHKVGTREELLDQIPDGRDGDFPLRRHDEY